MATTRRKQLAKAFLKCLMDILKVVDLYSDTKFPVVLIYTAVVYWIFRGMVGEEAGYE